MKIEHIFNSWASITHVDSFQEFMSIDNKLLTDLVLDRNLIVIRGLGPNLSDEEFYSLGEKFGNVWSRDDYKKSFISGGTDSTINYKAPIPVSYFQSDNNMWKDNSMAYHADMPHVNELSYPGRLLYMVNNTIDGSGDTTWLNMELAWEQLTQEEKDNFNVYEMVFQDMYVPGTRLETLPFLKINPKTNKLSPRLNCYSQPQKDNTICKAWIQNVLNNGEPCTSAEFDQFMITTFRLLESKTDTLYKHVWETGDIIVYDNWFNVHKREKVNGPRLLKRLTFNFI
jgi:alpha-ketoglutarate-dependent taurine dioxygenase